MTPNNEDKKNPETQSTEEIIPVKTADALKDKESEPAGAKEVQN